MHVGRRDTVAVGAEHPNWDAVNPPGMSVVYAGAAICSARVGTARSNLAERTNLLAARAHLDAATVNTATPPPIP